MTTSADDRPLAKPAASLDTISAQMSRAIIDIESIQEKLDGLLAFRWTISGAIGLIAFFGLSICGFVGWSLWDDNSRLLTVEKGDKDISEKLNQAGTIVDDYNKWRAGVNQKLQTMDDKQTLHGWNK